jgi:hypothetical protein
MEDGGLRIRAGSAFPSSFRQLFSCSGFNAMAFPMLKGLKIGRPVLLQMALSMDLPADGASPVLLANFLGFVSLSA